MLGRVRQALLTGSMRHAVLGFRTLILGRGSLRFAIGSYRC